MQTARSLCEFDSNEWNTLSAGTPFQSYQWYQFGERIMDDSPLTVIVVRDGNKPVARATLWLIRNEPLPLPAGIRNGLRYFFRNHPLLICRSPLADSTGLVFAPDANLEIKRTLLDAAQKELKRQSASFLLFDFMDSTHEPWQADLSRLRLSDPGTFMEVSWSDFESYLSAGNKKDRQHYKRSQQKAREHGLELSQHSSVIDMENSLVLIEKVADKFGSTANPWINKLLENLQMIDSTWLEVHLGNKLVGCGALVRDNGVQIATALGLDEEIPYTYFLLIYAAIKEGIEHRMKAIRLGSGAYDVKHRLGLHDEDNNSVAFHGNGIIPKSIARLASWTMKD